MNTVNVCIAVGVDANGEREHLIVFRDCPYDRNQRAQELARMMERPIAVYFVTAELPIPSPSEIPGVVEGEKEPAI